jgi:hypothetical protein
VTHTTTTPAMAMTTMMMMMMRMAGRGDLHDDYYNYDYGWQK